jgi:hypothetical protein
MLHSAWASHFSACTGVGNTHTAVHAGSPWSNLPNACVAITANYLKQRSYQGHSGSLPNRKLYAHCKHEQDPKRKAHPVL